jgi:hypothetical protein
MTDNNKRKTDGAQKGYKKRNMILLNQIRHHKHQKQYFYLLTSRMHKQLLNPYTTLSPTYLKTSCPLICYNTSGPEEVNQGSAQAHTKPSNQTYSTSARKESTTFKNNPHQSGS